MSTELSRPKPKQYKLFAYAGKVRGMKDIVLKEMAKKAAKKEAM